MERATLDAVPPTQRVELDGWLIAIDDGVVSRARSATPLSHVPALARGLDAVMARYAAASQPACFRLPETSGLAEVQTLLHSRGLVDASPTRVQVAESAQVATLSPARALADGATLHIAAEPDDAWCAVFLGDGVAADEAASRTAILRRARHARYASVTVDGQTVATGMGSFSEGWASVHGMRTWPAHRGRGFASVIVRALALEALQRGLPQMFLQVEQANTGAQALYRRLGFADLWVYRYWSER